MLLSEARTQVANILDDPDNVRWTSAEIDTALNTALLTVVSKVATQNSLLDEEVTITPTAGVADLASYAPIKIKNCSMVLGSLQTPIPESSAAGIYQTAEVVTPLICRIVRSPTFPASSSSAFTYGNGITQHQTIDSLIVYEAALTLFVKDREAPSSLVNQVANLYDVLQNYLVRGRVSQLSAQKTITPYARQTMGYKITIKWAQI